MYKMYIMPAMSRKAERYGVAEARKQISDILDDVQFRGKTVFLTRNDRDVAVVLPVDQYERLLDKERSSEEDDAPKRVQTGVRVIGSAGDTKRGRRQQG